VDVILEVGPKRRTFARVDEWPGWCRSGRDETAAMSAVAACRERYAGVVASAGLSVQKGELRVSERISGGAVTDFGALARAAEHDRAALTRAQLNRYGAVLAAAWAAFEAAFADVPIKHREVKPERGRAPQDILQHVVETDLMHLSGIAATSFRKPAARVSAADLRAVHARIVDALATVRVGTAYEPVARFGFDWTPRFVVHRSA
jgi:hypothetical protein